MTKETNNTKVSGRLLDIVSGKTGMAPHKAEQVRARLAAKGYKVPKQPVRHRGGLTGDILATKIQSFPLVGPIVSTCAKCKKLKDEMNSKSPDWCQDNFDAIIEKMKRNHLVAKFAPVSMLKKYLQDSIDEARIKVRPSRGFASAFVSSGTPRFISSEQYAKDVRTLATKVPVGTTAIAGVARSGLAAATMVSMYTHLPMYTIRQNLNDVQQTGNGWRLGGLSHKSPSSENVFVVDDTVMTGNSYRALQPLLKKQFGRVTTSAVYVNPLAKLKPDLWVHDLGWPHLLEWNLFNSVLSPNMGVDMDGILCRDCTYGEDDDGDRYTNFINTAEPLYLPRKCPIPVIITARIEKYREATKKWLSRHGVQFQQLVMHPAKNLAQRQRVDIPRWKAREVDRWKSSHRIVGPPPVAYIESDDRQARLINRHSGVMTICPASAKVYGRK